MIMLKVLWGRVWPYLALIAAAFAAFFGIRQSGKSAARAEMQAEKAQATIEGMKNARKARDEIDSLDDAAVRDRARQRMRNRAR